MPIRDVAGAGRCRRRRAWLRSRQVHGTRRTYGLMTDPMLPFDGKPIRVLLIEDSEEDYRRTCDLLDAARLVTFAIDRARSVTDALMRLGSGAYDVCLLEPRLPEGQGLELVRAAHNRSFRAPIIILTGSGTLELDVEAMALASPIFSTRPGSMPRASSAHPLRRHPASPGRAPQPAGAVRRADRAGQSIAVPGSPRARDRVGAAARSAGRRHDPRPQRLQGSQRPTGTQRRRSPAHHHGGAAHQTACARPTPSPGSAATSSRC